MIINNKDYSKLNLGCGELIQKKLPLPWLNVDIDGSTADIISDIRSLPMEWSNSFEEVRASHILEHFYLNEIDEILSEWIRVLKPNGVLRIIVPDLTIIVNYLITGKDSKNRKSISINESTPVLSQIYGVGYENSKTEERWRHHFVFNKEILFNIMKRQSELRNIRTYDKNNDPVVTYGIKDDSQNIFSLCMMAEKSK